MNQVTIRQDKGHNIETGQGKPNEGKELIPGECKQA